MVTNGINGININGNRNMDINLLTQALLTLLSLLAGVVRINSAFYNANR